MCGICGVAATDPRRPIDPAMVRRMTNTLWHRGPDGEGQHTAEGVGLGMRRLSIVDLATGDQPIASEDGQLVLVCNGEIYNHVELRQELVRAGHRFRTGSDVEVILHLYEDRGLACVDALRGMFAFALWDAPKRRLVLARDRVGIKPLHYAERPEGLYFGSEAKAILASRAVPVTLDPAAMHELFTFGFPLAPRTMTAAVRRLPPAHLLVYESGRSTLQRYWAPSNTSTASPTRSADDWTEELFACLDESVRLHLRSDVPVGAWLSPGLDSSGIVALMCRHVAMPVRTFSLGFQDPDADELRGNRTLADFAGYALVAERDVSSNTDFDRLPEAVWHNEDPSTTGLEVPRLLLSELAGQRVKVVLTGEGADELFGGYFWYHLDRTLAPFGLLPRPVRALAGIPAVRSRWPWASRVMRAPRALGRARLGAMIGPPAGGLKLLRPEVRAAAAAAAARDLRRRRRVARDASHECAAAARPLDAAARSRGAQSRPTIDGRVAGGARSVSRSSRRGAGDAHPAVSAAAWRRAKASAAAGARPRAAAGAGAAAQARHDRAASGLAAWPSPGVRGGIALTVGAPRHRLLRCRCGDPAARCAPRGAGRRG